MFQRCITKGIKIFHCDYMKAIAGFENTRLEKKMTEKTPRLISNRPGLICQVSPADYPCYSIIHCTALEPMNEHKKKIM